MPFVGEIFAQLKAAGSNPVLQEIRDGQITAVTGAELLELVQRARTFLASKSLAKGERCGLLAANSIRWIAMDMAATAEGLIPMPNPAMLKIVQYGDSEFNLLYCDNNGDWMNDTLHYSLQGAKDAANDEYGVRPEEWLNS